MKNAPRLMACLFTAVLLLQGCAPLPGPSKSGKGISAQPHYTKKDGTPISQEVIMSPQQISSGEPLRVFLPATHGALREGLSAMASAEGFALEVETAPSGPGYAAHLKKSLLGNKAPALFWVESPGAAQPLAQDGALLDLSGEGVSPYLRALAQKVPTTVQLAPDKLQNKKSANTCYGLPVGYYAEGTIVNIDLLAQLLGTSNTAELAANLTKCTWEEWQAMAETLQSYLQKPAKSTVVLAGTSYTTPRFRPEDAQALRGLFALQTQGGELFTSGLAAAISAAFPEYKNWNDATPGEIKAELSAPLAALAEVLRLESASMVGTNGLVPRGEGFAASEEISATQLRQIMGGQTALFARGNTRTAAQIQQEHPALINKLALVPAKLRGQDGQSGTNALLQAGSEGYLCASATASPAQQAQISALLVRFFISSQGKTYITQNMRLVTFSATYSTNELHTQLAALIEQGKFYTPPAGQMATQKQSEAIGRWALKNLLTKDEWQDEDINNFVVASLKEFGVLES